MASRPPSALTDARGDEPREAHAHDGHVGVHRPDATPTVPHRPAARPGARRGAAGNVAGVCDCLLALPVATVSGRTLFAKNSDRPPDEAQELEWLPPRRDDRPVRATYVDVAPAPDATLGVLGSRPWWTWGLEHGVNEAGVAIGNERIFTTLDPAPAPPALIGMDLVRLGLERAATAHDAVDVMVELLERYGQGGSGFHGVDEPYWSSFLVADPTDAWVLETSGRRVATEQVARSRAISNRTTIPAFDADVRDVHQPTAERTDPRLRASQAVLAHEPVTVDRCGRTCATTRAGPTASRCACTSPDGGRPPRR